MFEPWQIGDDYKEWQKLKRENIAFPLRFGQYFMNKHNLSEHTTLFYEENPVKALAYIQKNLMNSLRGTAK